MSDERVHELAKICVEWNKREIDSKEAMCKVWKLFEKESLELWNRKG